MEQEVLLVNNLVTLKDATVTEIKDGAKYIVIFPKMLSVNEIRNLQEHLTQEFPNSKFAILSGGSIHED